MTDHNEISGAHAARELAERDGGIKVIVAEEVKTADQGEVIGLFIEEKIARGMTLAETIAEIRRQGGLVYVPHPFDRMHAVPDYEHLLEVVADVDAIEVFNPRVAFSAFNEEAERFAAKYRIVAGAGSDSHVPQGLGSVQDPDARLRRAAGVPRIAARGRHRASQAEPRVRAGAQVPADEGARLVAQVQADKANRAARAPAPMPAAGKDRCTGKERRPRRQRQQTRCRRPTTRSGRSTSSVRSAS